MAIILYIRAAPPQWHLPALGVPDIQLQVYLQLAGLEYTTKELHDPAESRTGHLPAIEHESDLPDVEDASASDFDTARFLLHHLCANVVNLNEQLESDVEPDVIQWTSLIEMHLEPATIFSTWCEDQSYTRFTQKAYGSALPFPLSYISPWRQRQLANARFADTSATKVYDSAGEAYASLANHLQRLYPNNAPILFFLGPTASTVDVALYSHLLYHYRSPVSAPELRAQLARHPILERYLDSLTRSTSMASARAPPRPRSGWQRRSEDSQSRPDAAADKQKQKVSKWWMGGIAAIMAVYVVLLGYKPSSPEWMLEGDEDDLDM